MSDPISSKKLLNPWRAFIENVIEGKNYFRAGEYMELLADLDRLYAIEERASADPAPAASNELLPCPHCGRAVTFDHIPAHKHTVATFMPDAPDTYVIECVCGAGACGHESEEEVRGRWNARAAHEPCGECDTNEHCKRPYGICVRASQPRRAVATECAQSCWLKDSYVSVENGGAPLPCRPGQPSTALEKQRDVVAAGAKLVQMAMEEDLATKPPSAWQSIETAPKDGTTVMLYRDMEVFKVRGFGYYSANDPIVSGWISFGFDEPPGNLGLAHPTHWQPLPSPPTKEAAPKVCDFCRGSGHSILNNSFVPCPNCSGSGE